MDMFASSAVAGRSATMANSASPRAAALRALKVKSRRKTESANCPRIVAVNTVSRPSAQNVAVWSRMGRRMDWNASPYIFCFVLFGFVFIIL